MASGPPFWVTLAAATIGSGVLIGALVKGLVWPFQARQRREASLLSTAASRKTDAEGALIREQAREVRTKTEGERFDLFDDMLRRYEQLQEKTSRIQTQLDATLGVSEALTRRVNQVEQDLLRANDDRRVLEVNLAAEREAHKVTAAQLATATARIETLEAQVAGLQADNDRLRGASR